MIGIDTNVLVRYITQDDQQQSKKANKIIEINKSAINMVTEAKTTARVVATPTPFAPPLVLYPTYAPIVPIK